MRTLPAFGFVSVSAILGAAIAVAGGPASAQQPDPLAPPETLNQVIACRSLTDSAARLACYDVAVAAFDSARTQGQVLVIDREQISATRREMFGFTMPQLPALLARGEPVEAIETTLERAVRGPNGDWTFTLADGSVWRQVDSEGIHFRNRAGERVRVRQGALGSFIISIGNGSGRVKRQ